MSHALAALVAILTLVQPADWPQFRGPNGSGVYEGSALPAELTKETTSWSVDVPFGRSSPVVLGARVFITGSDGDRLITLCLNRSDGSVLWRHEAKRARVEERLERLNDPASPTPAVDATGVYVFFPDLGLLALGHDGRERWRVPLGPFHSAYGLASSPIVVDGLVVQICDQQQGSFVVAIDAKSGRVAWRADRSEMRTILLPGPPITVNGFGAGDTNLPLATHLSSHLRLADSTRGLNSSAHLCTGRRRASGLSRP